MHAKLILKSSSLKEIDSEKTEVSDSVFFVKTNSHPSYFKIVQNAFKKMIGPIYGDQRNAIAKIKDSLDRNCEIMLKCENPLGVIVYKSHLQNEHGLENALELKTLFLFNPDKNSGQGLGSRLFQRIDEIAQEMGTDTIYCTASSKVENSIKCALKNGYSITRVLEQNEDGILYLLIKKI